MRRLFLFLLFSLWAIPTFAFSISLTASGGRGSWADGVYSAAVGNTVNFSCTPSGGSSPYTYSWDFDDVESYKSPTSTQNPSHTFNSPGLHRVWVTVTDNASNEEEALLFVRLRDNITEYDAITDCGCVDDNSTDNQAALQSCIDGDADGNMRIIFRKTDTGIYKFVAFEENVEGDRDDMLDFEGSDKIELIGEGHDGHQGTAVTLLWAPLQDRGGFFWLDTENDTEYIYGENLSFEYDEDDAFIMGQHAYNGTERDLWRDCHFENIRKTCRGNSQTVIRCTFNQWGKNIGNLNYGWTKSLWKRNYIHNPKAGHSHVFYNREHDYMYYYENYMDVDPPGENDKVGFHMRDGRPAQYGSRDYTEIVGNLIRNVPSWPVKFRQYDEDGVLNNAKINDNIIINCDRNDAIGITTSDSNNEINGNFFMDIDVTCINLGIGYEWPTIADLTINNNHFGWQAGSDTGEATIECTAGGGCSYSESGSVDDTAKHRPGDPEGWWDADGYVDPGEYEYVPPVIFAATSSGTIVQTISMSEDGSGMGAGAGNARFPFRTGAILQATDGDNNYSEVTDYSATPNHSFSGLSTVSQIRVADVDRNWSSLYITSAGSSNVGIQGSFTLPGGVSSYLYGLSFFYKSAFCQAPFFRY